MIVDSSDSFSSSSFKALLVSQNESFFLQSETSLFSRSQWEGTGLEGADLLKVIASSCCCSSKDVVLSLAVPVSEDDLL